MTDADVVLYLLTEFFRNLMPEAYELDETPYETTYTFEVYGLKVTFVRCEVAMVDSVTVQADGESFTITYGDDAPMVTSATEPNVYVMDGEIYTSWAAAAGVWECWEC